MNLKSCGGQRVIQYETVCLERLMTERLNGSPMEASSSRAAEAGKPAAQQLAPQPHISQVYHALAVSHLVLGDAWGSHLRLDGHTGGFIPFP